MSPVFGEFSIFDDKGEVRRMVEAVVQQVDPEVTIDRMRKINFSYLFTLARGTRIVEVDLHREEIDASWGWRNGNVDEILQRKIEDAIAQL